MASRKHWSASALTEATTTSNTVWSDMATMTIPLAEQTASKQIYVFWNGAFAIGQTTSDVQFRVTVDGVAETAANLEPWRVSPMDYTHTGGFFDLTIPGTPAADIVVKIQFKSETSGQTSRAKNTRLAAIEAGSNDVYVESLTRVTRATASFVDGVTATFTPPSTGNYVALLCGYIDTNATFNGAGDIRLSDGTNTTATLGIIGYDTTNLVPFVIGWRRSSLAASSQTIKAQYQAESSGVTMGLSEQRLLILRESDFDAVYAALLASDSASTAATYTDALTLTQTTAANDHLQIAAWFHEGSSSALQNLTQLTLDASTVGEMAHTTIDATVDQSGHGVFVAQIGALTAASHTWKIQRKSETTSTTTYVKRDATIFVFDLGTSSGSISGTASITEASDTSAATGVLPIVATLSGTEANDTSTATAKLTIVATASLTEASDTVSGTGLATPLSAAASITEASDTASATAVLPIVATATISEATDTVAAAGALPITANLSATEASDTLSSLAGAPAVIATANITEASDSVTAAAVLPIVANATIQEAADTAAGIASTPVAAVAAITEASDTLSAASVLPLNAQAAIAEAGDAATSTAALPLRATASITEAGDTLTSVAGSPQNTGAASILEDSDTVAGVARLIIVAAATLTEAPDTCAGSGALELRGFAAIQEAADTASAAGALLLKAAAAIAEGGDTSVAAGATLIRAALAAFEDGDLLSAAGRILAPYVTPPERILAVLADVRRLLVPTEPRQLQVDPERRTLAVEADPDTL